MKSQYWKTIETKTAKFLNDTFSPYNISPTARKPVNGRHGPDLEPNELGLIIDIKHRNEIPIGFYLEHGIEVRGNLLIVRLEEILDLLNEEIDPVTLPHRKPSMIVNRYWKNIDKSRVPNGTPCLVLHHKNKSIGASTFVINRKDLKNLQNRWRQLNGKEY